MSAMTYRHVQAVLWDMDGTLVNTEHLWLESEVQTMAHYGSHWDAQDQAIAVGGPMDRVINYMADRVQRPAAEVSAYLLNLIEELMHTEHIPWMPGARQLHDELTAAHVPQALVSNSWRHLMESALADVHTSFDVIIAGDEVESPKPDPMPYLLAAHRLGATLQRTVVIEDSPTGVQAGLAAGAWVIGVPHVGELPAHERLLTVSSLTEVSLATIDGWSQGIRPAIN